MNSTSIRVMIDASIPYLRGNIPQGIEASFCPNEEITAESLQDQDALLIRSVTKCNESLLHNTQVKCIATATAGFDHIDRSYCESHNIAWFNAPGCNASGVVQYVLSALALWSREQHRPISSFRLGIVGVGHVGGLLNRYARLMGIQTFLCDPPRAEKEAGETFYRVEELPHLCDVISFHTPLIRGGAYPSYHMVDTPFLESCKVNKLLLINAARGAVWNTVSVLDALEQRWIADVVVDCWENEPNLFRPLMQRAFLATPHIAGFSTWGKSRGAQMALGSICRCFGIDFTTRDAICPEPPSDTMIDVGHAEDPLSEALIRTFDPRKVESELRAFPETFEAIRVAYSFHHEMSSFEIRGANSDDLPLFRSLGFCISDSL